jgi:hypothetical protein
MKKELDIESEKYEELLDFWDDSYKLELCINAHINEIKDKLTYMNSVDVSTYYKEEKDRLKFAYQKELADLFILLIMFFEKSNSDYDDLLNIRVNKFLEKARNQKLREKSEDRLI